MILKNRNILMISPEPWDHLPISKHHYAKVLAMNGNKVFFTGPPKKENKYNIRETETDGLYVLEYKPFIRGVRFLPSFVQKVIMKNKADKIEEASGVRFDVIWSFDNSVFFDFSVFDRQSIKISHIVDLDQDFQLEKAASTADVCFCTTDHILEKLKEVNENSYLIRHGYRYDPDHKGIDVNLPGKPDNVKVLYGGNLRMKLIDWNVFRDVIEKNPGLDFIFLGPGIEDVDQNRNPSEIHKPQVERFENTFFVGRVPSSHLRSYYEKADILLICYREEMRKDAANPHKVLDYLASGKVVVASYTDQYVDMEGDFLVMVEKNWDLPTMVSKVASKLDHYNSKELMEKRLDWAMDNTYAKQVQRIDRILQEHISTGS